MNECSSRDDSNFPVPPILAIFTVSHSERNHMKWMQAFISKDWTQSRVKGGDIYMDPQQQQVFS